MNSTFSIPDSRLFITCHCDNLTLPALVDTGAVSSIIDIHTANRLDALGDEANLEDIIIALANGSEYKVCLK